MKYYKLKHFDKTLVTFRFERDKFGAVFIEIVEVFTQNKRFLPLGLEMANDSLLSWIKSRTIPKNREFVYKILMELDLSLDDIEGIVNISKSLSLNDCYWIVDDSFEGKFEDYNLYDNSFNKTLSLLAYTGYASVKKSAFISSPEFTTNGMLAKAWRKNPQRKNGIFLYKSGSSGFANSGKEPYSEFYASQVAFKMGLNITTYELSKWKKRLNSVCKLFSSKEVSFVPIYHLVKSGGWEAVMKYYKSLGDEFYNDLIDMLVFDIVIVNTDRHFGNFGLLIDNKTNQIIKTAPIFDNGLSLFCDALDDEMQDLEKLAQTKYMKNAGDFKIFAKTILDARVKQRLKKLINFRFLKHPSYNLNSYRLKQIERFIQKRVLELLEM